MSGDFQDTWPLDGPPIGRDAVEEVIDEIIERQPFPWRALAALAIVVILAILFVPN